jgi:hypothetical protein
MEIKILLLPGPGRVQRSGSTGREKGRGTLGPVSFGSRYLSKQDSHREF